MRLRSIISHPRARVSALCSVALLGAASQAWAQSQGAGTAAQLPYNIIFVISDQEADHLLVTGNDYELPARAELRRRGIDFRNHYTAQQCARHPGRRSSVGSRRRSMASSIRWNLPTSRALARHAEHGLGAEATRLYDRLLRQIRIE